MAIHAVTTKEIPKRELRVPPVHLVGAESLYGPVTTKEIPKRELRAHIGSNYQLPEIFLRYNKRNPKKGIESLPEAIPTRNTPGLLQQKKSQKGN
jgi:hypothetical protein